MGHAGHRDYTRSSDQRAGPQKPNRIKNCSSTPLLPVPQPGWRVVHQSPQIQRSLPPVPPPSSAVGGARPPGPIPANPTFSAPRATSLFCCWWRATSRTFWLGVRVLFDHPDIFLCRPGLCVLNLKVEWDF